MFSHCKHSVPGLGHTLFMSNDPDVVWSRLDAELARRADRRETPGSWADLARRLETTEQRLNNWRRRGVPPRAYGEVADVLGWTVDQVAGRDAAPRVVTVPLRDALRSLGQALAQTLPDDVRQDVADVLAKLALRHGAERHQLELATLLAPVQNVAVVPASKPDNLDLDHVVSQPATEHGPASPQQLGGADRKQSAPGEPDSEGQKWISNAPRTDKQQDHKPGRAKSSKSSGRARK